MRSAMIATPMLGIPYPYLANDMVKGNFSNSRLALIEFHRAIAGQFRIF